MIDKEFHVDSLVYVLELLKKPWSFKEMQKIIATIGPLRYRN